MPAPPGRAARCAAAAGRGRAAPCGTRSTLPDASPAADTGRLPRAWAAALRAVWRTSCRALSQVRPSVSTASAGRPGRGSGARRKKIAVWMSRFADRLRIYEQGSNAQTTRPVMTTMQAPPRVRRPVSSRGRPRSPAGLARGFMVAGSEGGGGWRRARPSCYRPSLAAVFPTSSPFGWLLARSRRASCCE